MHSPDTEATSLFDSINSNYQTLVDTPTNDESPQTSRCEQCCRNCYSATSICLLAMISVSLFVLVGILIYIVIMTHRYLPSSYNDVYAMVSNMENVFENLNDDMIEMNTNMIDMVDQLNNIYNVLVKILNAVNKLPA